MKASATAPSKRLPSAIVQDRIARKDGKLPWGFWKNPVNRKLLFDNIGNQLGVKQLDDWYHVTSSDFKKLGFFSLLQKKYQGSVYQALSSVYPEHRWSGWKFAENSRIPRQCLNDPSELHKFVSELSDKLFVKHLDDWYRVSHAQIYDAGASILIKKFKTLANVLQLVYPHHKWEKRLFSISHKKASQRWLRIVITNLFKPGIEILENHQHHALKWEGTRRRLELDIFIPSLNLAIEYNGVQHYKNVAYFSPTVQYQTRDNLKEQACQSAGIKLVSIPYWWDRKKESLVATIFKSYPQLIEHMNFEALQIPNSKDAMTVISTWSSIPQSPPV